MDKTGPRMEDSGLSTHGRVAPEARTQARMSPLSPGNSASLKHLPAHTHATGIIVTIVVVNSTTDIFISAVKLVRRIRELTLSVPQYYQPIRFPSMAAFQGTDDYLAGGPVASLSLMSVAGGFPY